MYNIRSCKIYFDCECTRREAKSVRETASVGGPLPLPKTKIISAAKEIRNGQTNNVQCRPSFCHGTYFCHTIFSHKFSYEKNIYLLLIMQKHKICVILY